MNPPLKYCNRGVEDTEREEGWNEARKKKKGWAWRNLERNKKYVGQGESKIRIEEGVKEQDEKLSVGDFACVY